MPQCSSIIQGCTTIFIIIHKQLYVISFLFFDNLAIVSRITLQVITSPDNTSVCNRHNGYLRLSFISICVCYIFNIPLVIFSLYLLATTRIWEMKLSLLHCCTVISCNIWSWKVACDTIQGWTTNEYYYYINVICIQTVLH